MHTVFVNASKQQLKSVLENVVPSEIEYRQIMCFDHPLSKWNDADDGIAALADKIGFEIDRDKELTNSFQLIVYTDLPEFREYTDALGKDSVEKNADIAVIEQILAGFVSNTIYKKLEEAGRRPAGKVLLIIEQNAIENPTAGDNVDLATGVSVKQKRMKDAFLRMVGFPDLSAEYFDRIASLPTREERIEALENGAKASSILEALDPRSLYAEELGLFFRELADRFEKEDADPAGAIRTFYESFQKRVRSDFDKRVMTVSFITDRRSAGKNKEIVCKTGIWLCAYLMECVNNGTTSSDGGPREIAEMTDEKWSKVVKHLAWKKEAFEFEEKKLAQMNSRFDDEKVALAPPLYEIDRNLFGLDENGCVKTSFEIRTEEEDNASKEETKADNTGKTDEEGPVKIVNPQVELVETQGEIRRWFTEDEFAPFQCEAPVVDADAGRSLSPEQYCGAANRLAEYHLSFLKKLDLHVSDVMSHYAGRSLSNVPALLRKRAVDAGEENVLPEQNDYKYAPKKDIEKRSVESVLKTAQNSLCSMIIEYLKFNNGREVAVTSLKSRCERFIARVKQIEESLRKLAFVVSVISGVLLVLMTPFVLIQWNGITKNVDTLAVALAFFFGPFALLSVGYGVAKTIQRRKIRKLWAELAEEHRKMLSHNRAAIEMYDDLLVKVIPALRWVYEYNLDAQFYSQCSSIAHAKLSHHSQKLREFKEKAGNLLDDLEKTGEAPDDKSVEVGINYAKAFCDGNNRDFYSIIDKTILKIIYGDGGVTL